MAAPVILVEAQPAIVATGGTVTVRLAGGGGERPYDYSGQSDWRAGIAALPTMIASLEYDGGEFPQGSVPSAVEIAWQGSSKTLLATLASYLWTDAAITVRYGPEGALPPVLISGKVLDATAESGGLKIALADPAVSLKKPLLTARFAGTGGLEGPVEWDGLIRKRVWGRVWNLAGEPIDKANNIYAFADPLRPIQAFDAVRDKGAAAAALTTLAWQGSAAATFTALQAAVAPAGGGVICPSIACVKWWTQPAGDLCADLRGEVGAGYVETTASIAQRLVEAIGGPAFTAGTIAAANAARTAPVGWIAQDDSTTVAAMLDELLGNSSLLWLLEDAGTITLRTWSWGAAVATARSESVERAKVLRPLGTRRLGYKRNETMMARGDLAAIVLAGDVNYADGTPIEALKPADPGATAGADIGVDLRLPTYVPTQAQLITAEGTAAAIAGQGPLATAPSATPYANSNVTIGSNGLLNGAGGGQVTIGGLGYTGALNATYGATTGLNLSSPTYGVLSDGSIYTPIGTAAAIAGQGPFATTPLPVARLTQIRPNLFPYPQGVDDGRSAAAIGWFNTAPGAGFSNLTMGRNSWTDGGYYVHYRSAGAAATLYPFFDMSWNDGGGHVISAGLNGYANGGTFQPYIEFINAAKTTVLGSAVMTFNSASDRWEVNGTTTPANTAYIRIVASAIFASTSTYQDVVFWSIKVERGPNATPCLETPNQRLSGDQVEWATGGKLNALRPQEFGANITESRVASAIAGQTGWATYSGDSPATYALRVQYIDTSGQLSGLNRVVDRKLTYLSRADGVTALTEAMAITSLGTAAAIVGQGPGATAANLAAFDPTAASQLTTAYNGGVQTVGIGETLKRRIAAGGSLDLSAQVSVNAGGSSSGNIKARIEVSLFGAGSWSTVNTGPGASVTPSEPGLDEVTGTYTNSTGAEQLFEFRVVIVRTPGTAGGTIISAQSFIVG